MCKSQAAVVLLLSLIILTLAGSACKSVEPLSCDVISETVFSTFPTGETDPTAIRKWINVNYTSASTSLTEYPDVYGDTDFSWSYNQKDYSAFVSKDRSVLKVQWKGRKPNLKEVIGCLGYPEFYDASIVPAGQEEFPRTAVVFSIWYPAKGLVLSFYQHSSRLVVSDSTSFDMVAITRSDEVRLYKVKPWPADLNDLQLDH